MFPILQRKGVRINDSFFLGNSNKSFIPNSRRYTKYSYYWLPSGFEKISSQALSVTMDGTRYDGDGVGYPVNTPVIDSAGWLHSCGGYTNHIVWSEDISQATWVKYVSPIITGTNGFKGTAQYSQVISYLTTAEGVLYTLSMTLSVAPGGRTTGCKLTHVGSASGDTTSITLTTTPTLYTTTVLGKVGGGGINFGFADWNTSNFADIVITKSQLSTTSYRLPYVKTQGAAVAVPQNYPDGTKQLGMQITPDPVAGPFTGKADGVELVTNGGFDSDTGWDKFGGTAISGGTANLLTTGGVRGRVFQPFDVVAGVAYNLSFNILSLSLGIIAQIRIVTGFPTGSIEYTYTTAQQVSINFVCTTSGTLGIHFQITTPTGVETAVIDNVSVQKLSRNLGLPLALDALDGAVTVTGTNKLTNGDFATGDFTGWTKNGTVTWEIISDSAFTNAAKIIRLGGTHGFVGFYQSGVFTVGKSYEITCRVKTNTTKLRVLDGTTVKASLPVTANETAQTISVRLRNMLGPDIYITFDNESDDSKYFIVDDIIVKELSPAQGELDLQWMPMFNAADVTTEGTLISVNDTTPMITHMPTGRVKLSDGTNTVISDASYTKETQHDISAIFGDHPTLGTKKMQLVVNNQASVIADFDGRFDPSTRLSFRKNNAAWNKTKLLDIKKSPTFVTQPDVGIGYPGSAGFGVGICPSGSLPTGMTPLSGYDNPTSANYGNYQFSDGSIMVFVPKFYVKVGDGTNGFPANFVDIKSTAATGYALHLAFMDGGVEKPGFFVDKYMCSKNAMGAGFVASSVKDGLPLSTNAAHNPIAGLTVCTSNAYYEAINAAKARDGIAGAVNPSSNFFCTSRFIYAALALLSLVHGQAANSTASCAWYDSTGAKNYPKGCNNNALGDTDDGTVLYTSDGYSNCGKTGSGVPFAKTTDNGQACGVADLNGLMWEVSIGITCIATSKTITAATKANPCELTVTGHGLTTGAQVMITSVGGMTELNDKIFAVTFVDANRVTLNGVNSTGFASYTSGGSLTSGTFYRKKDSVSMKDFTSGNTLATDHWGATGVAAMMEPFDMVFETAYPNNGFDQRMGSGANQVLSAALTGNGAVLRSLGIPRDADGVGATSTNLFGKDYYYQYVRNELCVRSGGYWSNNSDAGVWNVYWNNTRAYSHNDVGFRCACYPV